MNDDTPLPVWSTQISAEAMRTWCTLLRDDNPIHLDAAEAARLGFGRGTVNPGPANLALLLNLMMQALPDQEVAEVEAHFMGEAVAGDVVHASGVPSAEQPSSWDTKLVRDDQPLVAARIRMRDAS